ncbi:prepilin peptidase [Microlunatus elymi]|uniref:prepilin peptidase n=1 Tax=Microlunatus elymi TaxID=2596828 RepID=UPI00143DD977|nr:prepilin peptidase [Microlunatus elymi]
MSQWWLVGLAAVLSAAAAWWLHRGSFRYDDDVIHHRPPVWTVPVVAVAGSVLAAPLVANRPVLVNLIFVLAWVWAVVLAFIDFSVRRLPDKLTLPAYPLAALGLALCSWQIGDWQALLWAAICAASAVVGFLLLALFGSSKEGLGLGDVKLAGVLGGLLGWLDPMVAVLGLLTGFILGGLVAVVIMIARRGGRQSHMTFGPAMILGAYLWALLG